MDQNDRKLPLLKADPVGSSFLCDKTHKASIYVKLMTVDIALGNRQMGHPSGVAAALHY